MSTFEITWEIFPLKLREVFTISRSSRTEVPVVFLKLTKDGYTGYGEASPNSRYEESPEKVEEAFSKITADFFNDIASPDELPAHIDQLDIIQSAKAAIEMAWLDWWAKSQHQPLWKLWGHEAATGPVTSYTIGIDTPEKMQQKVLEASDFPVYKVKLGTDHDRQLIEAIREVTDKPLRVDANEGWTSVEQANREIQFLAEQNIELIEQPMPAAMLAQMKELKKISAIPLCADESFIGQENIDELAEAFDVLNIKLMKIGSLVKARKTIEQAHDLGLKIMIGCMVESSLANAAGALIALQADYADLDGHLLISNDPFKGLHVDHEKKVNLSSQPGLGITYRK